MTPWKWVRINDPWTSAALCPTLSATRPDAFNQSMNLAMRCYTNQTTDAKPLDSGGGSIGVVGVWSLAPGEEKNLTQHETKHFLEAVNIYLYAYIHKIQLTSFVGG